MGTDLHLVTAYGYVIDRDLFLRLALELIALYKASETAYWKHLDAVTAAVRVGELKAKKAAVAAAEVKAATPAKSGRRKEVGST